MTTQEWNDLLSSSSADGNATGIDPNSFTSDATRRSNEDLVFGSALMLTSLVLSTVLLLALV
jgi:hypothetical protein